MNVAADRRHRCCSSKAMAFKEPVSQLVSRGGGSQGVNADGIFPAAVCALSNCTAQSTAGSWAPERSHQQGPQHSVTGTDTGTMGAHPQLPPAVLLHLIKMQGGTWQSPATACLFLALLAINWIKEAKANFQESPFTIPVLWKQCVSWTWEPRSSPRLMCWPRREATLPASAQGPRFWHHCRSKRSARAAARAAGEEVSSRSTLPSWPGPSPRQGQRPASRNGSPAAACSICRITAVFHKILKSYLLYVKAWENTL